MRGTEVGEPINGAVAGFASGMLAMAPRQNIPRMLAAGLIIGAGSFFVACQLQEGGSILVADPERRERQIKGLAGKASV